MSTSPFSIFSSIFGFIVAAVSLFAFLINICRSHLPSNRIKELESLMDETETFFSKSLEDGLLIEPVFVRQTERRLAMLRTMTYDLQSRAYNATTLHKDYLEFLRGTSRSIGGTCQSLKQLKAQIITSSYKGRRTRTERNSSPYSLFPLNPNSLPHPTSSPPLSGQSARPRSCPPTLCGFSSGDTQHGFFRGNPFGDPTQSDSDVRTTDALNCPSIIHTSVTLEPGA